MRSKKYLAINAVLIAFVIASCSSGSSSTTPAATAQTSNTDSSGDETTPTAGQVAVPVPLDRLVPSAIPDDIEPAVELNVSYSDSQSNTLTSEQMTIIPVITVEDMFTAYEAVVAANTSVPINTNEFSLLLVEYLNTNFSEARAASAFRVAGQDGFEDPPLGILGFLGNEAEKELLINNPRFIPATNDSLFRAGGATMIDGGTFNLLNPPWKDRGDAFRHAYWNWLLSDCCGLDWAETFTNAHESNQLNDDDSRMDLNNNAVGRAVYLANPSASAGDARAEIMSQNLLYVNESLDNVTIDDSRLVYLLPKQTMTLFDDGPSFDDIFGVAFDGVVASSTEVGGAITYDFVSIASGMHDLAITCEEDTTEAGCGFKYTFNGAMFNGMGTQAAGQIIIQKGETYSDSITFPKIIDLFTE